jgi:OmpA-OmpF porin, OOP family
MTIGRKSFRRYAMVLTAGLFLAGCSDWSYIPPLRGTYLDASMNVAKLQAAQSAPGASAFNIALAQNYASFSDSLLKNEWQKADADYFARKGLAAANGQIVPPENDGNWGIATPWDRQMDVSNLAAGYRNIISGTRVQLMSFLDANRASNPQLSARAQASFDCWVEHTEWNLEAGMNGPCHADLMKILGGAPVAVAVAVANTTNVYFEFDKSNLTPQAAQIVQQVANTAVGDPNIRILLVGKADRAGTDAYNMGLSHRRADSVRAELQKDGVTNNRIDERWVGEREPPVPTPDGVREPRNRVVEITIE